MKKYDIAIVGAGAAGLTCAWQLSEKTGASIAVLEADEKVSRDITPGTLNMDFVGRLKDWGFSRAIEHIYTKLGLYCADESARFDLGGRPVGAAINYKKFCQLLANRSDADIFTGTTAEKIENTGAGIRINSEFEAKLLIDASGAAHLTQKLTGARPPRKYSIVRGARLSDCSIEEPNEISLILDSPYCTNGGWFYPFGRSGASCGIAFLENGQTVDPSRAESCFDGMVKALKPFSEWTKGAVADSVERGVVPLEPLQKLAYDRIMTVGDAAGQAFPLLVEGLRPSFESAIMCSDFAAAAYESGDFSLKRLNGYELGWKRKNGRRYLMEQVSRDIAFGRSPEEWSDFTRKIKDFDSKTVIQFVSGDLRDKAPIRRKLPKKEALMAALLYLRYRFFHWL